MTENAKPMACTVNDQDAEAPASEAGGPSTTKDAVAARYDRIARFYDLVDKPADMFSARGGRERLLSRAKGKTLEVGVGTGRNLAVYGADVDLTGIDLSENMLARARRRAQRQSADVVLEVADVQHLAYDDNSFDTVTATCVFCSVADPLAGLREIARVVRPDGQVLLLEFVRPLNPVLGWLADRLAPVIRLMGPHINRRTEDNVCAAGLEVVAVRRSGTWREIVARPSTGETTPKSR